MAGRAFRVLDDSECWFDRRTVFVESFREGFGSWVSDLTVTGSEVVLFVPRCSYYTMARGYYPLVNLLGRRPPPGSLALRFQRSYR